MNKPGPYLLLRRSSGVWFTPRLVRHSLGLTGAIAHGGNLLRPANAHQKTTGQFLQRSLTLIVGEKQFTAQIISKGFPHICVRRRVSPMTVYTIY